MIYTLLFYSTALDEEAQTVQPACPETTLNTNRRKEKDITVSLNSSLKRTLGGILIQKHDTHTSSSFRGLKPDAEELDSFLLFFVFIFNGPWTLKN